MDKKTPTSPTPEETQSVIDFVIKRAKELQTHKLTGDKAIPLKELSPLFVNEPREEYHMNRIRHEMFDEFRTAKILPRWRSGNYEFTLDESINIDIVKEIEIERSKIVSKETSTNFQEEFIPPAWFRDLLDVLECGDKPILVGPQGCGKSRALEQAMAFLGRKVFRIALGEYRDPADLIGTKEIVEENGVPVTKLVGGLLTEAMENGYGIILDEYDMVAPGMVAALNKIMESGASMVLPTEKGTITFHQHPDTLIAATANTWGYGDDSGLFAGSQMQNRASWDRLRPKMDCDYDYEIEKRLVGKYLPEKVVEALYANHSDENKVGLVRKIRKAIADPKNPLDDVMGLRTILWFARMWGRFGWHKGLYYFLNDFRIENREAIKKIIQDRFGRDFVPTRNDYDKKASDYIPNLKPSVMKAIEKGFNGEAVTMKDFM